MCYHIYFFVMIKTNKHGLSFLKQQCHKILIVCNDNFMRIICILIFWKIRQDVFLFGVVMSGFICKMGCLRFVFQGCFLSHLAMAHSSFHKCLLIEWQNLCNPSSATSPMDLLPRMHAGKFSQELS